MNNSAKIAIGVAAGIVVGVISGILLAPAKGSDTRKRIAEGATDLADAIGDKFTGITKKCCNSSSAGAKETI